jgi:threonine/homoserine/homoserine lactone efflux protein
MELRLYLAFVAATLIMISFPGPSVLLTVAHSISFGWQRAISTVAGETVGVACQLILAAIGLASLLHTVAEAFEWLRWAGAAYLVYLGIKQWQSASVPLEFGSLSASGARLFVQGLVITIPNPKSLIFIAAFLPQFIDTTRPLGMQLVYIVPTFLMITFVVTSIWALVAGKARGFLSSQRVSRSVLRAAAVLMVIAGLGLAFARHGS